MNIYLTSISINCEEDDVRRILLDMCIDSLIKTPISDYLTIKGIIVPEWSNLDNVKTYRGICVKTIKTRDLTLFDPERECNSLRHDCPIVDIVNVRPGTDNVIDQEHQVLFEKMTVETPCLVSDSDLVFNPNHAFINLNKCLKDYDHSFVLLPSSHLFYIHKHDDKNTALIEQTTYLKMSRLAFKCTAHFNRGLFRHLPGYTIIRNKDHE
jgi:hypothetical protein